MNRGHVLQSSPVQMAAGNPNWCSLINNMRPPPPTHHHLQQQPTPFLPPAILFPPYTASPNSFSSSSSSSSSSSNSTSSSSLTKLPSWHENQDQLPESWSQLFLGGLVSGEEDKGNMGHFQAKKMENREEQVLHSGPVVDVKQENVASSCYNMYLHANQDHQDFHQVAAKPRPQIMPPANSSVRNNNKSCVTTTTSCLSNSTNMLDFSSANKGDGRHPPPDRSSECNSSGNGGAVKKARVQASCSTQSTFKVMSTTTHLISTESSLSHKVRKEKLGDRITALHQLVSPFGKTDTASVLLEVIGYIRFLQSQIEALSLPYLGNESQNMRQQHHPQQHAVNQGERNCIFPEDPGQLLNDNCIKRKVASSQQQDSIEEPKKDLRSRGLCLVPLSCTLQVGSENGGDFWAPAFGGGFR